MLRTKNTLLFIIASGTLLFGFAFLLLTMPEHALAQQDAFTPITPEAGNPLSRFFSEDASLAGFFNGLFQIAISVGGLLAVLQLAYGGWLYMTSEMGSKKEEARERIRNALIGLLMLLATVLVLRQINPDIVSLNILSGFGVVQEQTAGNPGGNDGPIDKGVTTGTPSGFCVDTWGGVQNNHASEYTRYVCYNSWQACNQEAGNHCAPYGAGAYSDPLYNDSYIDGSLPANAANYAQRVWVADIGRDADGNLNRCVDVKGSGWTDLPANYCGAYGSAGGQCCGLPKGSSDQTSPGGTKTYPASEVGSIPAGQWCYLKAGIYSCYSNQSICMAQTGTTDCRVRTTSETWADDVTSGGVDIRAEEFSTSEMEFIPEGRVCYLDSNTYFCFLKETECLSGSSGKACLTRASSSSNGWE